VSYLIDYSVKYLPIYRLEVMNKRIKCFSANYFLSLRIFLFLLLKFPSVVSAPGYSKSENK